uniref:Uncharacterized protein n=1 Tax=Sinocyclocheilus anshuiensis TaxID=1608454 RepID=A0A671LSG7_9TELE
ESHHPDHHTDTLGHFGVSQLTGVHGFGQGEVAVHADQHQEEYAAVVVHRDGGADYLAEQLTEVPLIPLGDGDRPEGQTQDHNEVCSCQVAQIHISYAARLPLEAEHAEDQTVAQHSQDADNSQKWRLER